MAHRQHGRIGTGVIAIVICAAGCAPQVAPSPSGDLGAVWQPPPTAERRLTTAGWSAVDLATLPGMRDDEPVSAIEGRTLYGVLGAADGAHAFAYDLETGNLADLGAAVEGGGVTVEGVADGVLYGQGSDGNGVIRPLLLDVATGRYTLLPRTADEPVRAGEAGEGIVRAVDAGYAVGNWLDPGGRTTAFAYRIADSSLVDLSTIIGAGKASTTADVLEDGIVAGTFTEEDGSLFAYAYNLDTKVVSNLNRPPEGMSRPQPKAIRDGIVYGTGTRDDGSQATWSSPWAQVRLEALPDGHGRLMTITDDGRYLLGTMIKDGSAADPRSAWMIDRRTGERIDLGVLRSEEPGQYSAFAFDGTDELVLGRLVSVGANGANVDTVLWQLPLRQ
jgi:hypothetical protein